MGMVSNEIWSLMSLIVLLMSFTNVIYVFQNDWNPKRFTEIINLNVIIFVVNNINDINGIINDIINDIIKTK